MSRARAFLGIGLVALVLVASGVAVASAAYVGSAASSVPSSDTTYNVTFTETGLPTGTNWTVAIFGVWDSWDGGGFAVQTSNNSSMSFSLTNGTYHYRAFGVPGFVATGARGSFNVTGASPAAINVSFAAPTLYTVTFSETGLATGTNWTVTVFGRSEDRWDFEHNSETSSGSDVNFSLANGTYFYHVSRVPGYLVNGSFGSVVVNGTAPAPINVTFTPLVTYAVTFNETGLPNGTNWTVHVVGLASGGGGFLRESATSSSTSITLNLPNGTYFYRVGSVGGWHVLGGERAGVFNVTGASPAPIGVEFVQDHHHGHHDWTPFAHPSLGWGERYLHWDGFAIALHLPSF